MQDQYARTYKIAPIYLASLAEAAAANGLDPGAFCAGLGFDIADLHTPGFTVTHQDACTAIRRALRVLPSPQLGFELGQRANLAARGALALGMLSSRTLKDAIMMMLRHPSSAGFLLDIDEQITRDQHVLTVTPMFGNGDLLPFLAEKTFASLVRLWRAVMQTSSYTPLAVYFTHAASEKRIRAYEQFFGCPVYFGAAQCRLVSKASWLDFELPFRSLVSYRLASDLLDRSFHPEGEATGIEIDVRAALKKVYRHRAPFAQVAARLGLSERTLRRRLADDGLSFQTLLDECRADYALALIGKTDIPLQELAEQTGFSSVSSLRRAFKRWTGRTLSEHNRATPSIDEET